MIKTGTFKISAELKQDLWVAANFDFDGITPPYGFVKTKNPMNIDIDKEIEQLKQNTIKSIIGDGKLISVSSETKPGIEDFIPYDEYTVTYEL